MNTGCTNSDRCQCDLNATYAGSRIFDQTVGKKQIHNLKFKITNQGPEPGYGARMKFLSPEIDLPFPEGGSPYVLQWNKVKVKRLSNVLLTDWFLHSRKFSLRLFLQFQNSTAKECKLKRIAENGINGVIEPEFELDLDLKDSSFTKNQIKVNVNFSSDCKGSPKNTKLETLTFNLKYESTFVKTNNPSLDKLQ